MSFSENPFRVLHVVSNEDGTYRYACDSCGGGWREHFPSDVSVEEMRTEFDHHLERSHKLTPADTEGWGVP